MTNATQPLPAFIAPVDRNKLLIEWEAADKALKSAQVKELDLRLQVAKAFFGEAPKEGTNNFDLGNGYKLKADIKFNYNLANKEGQTDAALDAMEKLGDVGKLLAERLVSWSPSLKVGEYRQLEDAYKKIIDKVLTISPGTPAVKIEAPKDKRS